MKNIQSRKRMSATAQFKSHRTFSTDFSEIKILITCIESSIISVNG